MDVALISITHPLARDLHTAADVEPVEGVPLDTEEVFVRVALEGLLLVASHVRRLLEEVIVADCSRQRGEEAVRKPYTEDGGQIVGDLSTVGELLHAGVIGLSRVLHADGGAELIACPYVQPFVVEVQPDDRRQTDTRLLDLDALVEGLLCQLTRDGEDGLYLLLECLGQVVDDRLSCLSPRSDHTEVSGGVVHGAVSTADLDVADVARVGVVGIAQTRTEVGTQVLVDLIARTSLQTKDVLEPLELAIYGVLVGSLDRVNELSEASLELLGGVPLRGG